MIVSPALDLRGGRVVRLRRGAPGSETVYGESAVEIARKWADQGAARLHLVDLDAAIDGRDQAEEIGRVIRAISIPVEVGGGLRDMDVARRYRDCGAERLIFGTAAVEHPDVVQAAAAEWPGAIAVAVDAREGRVATAGWLEQSDLRAVELALRVASWGVDRIQYTDVKRDGMLIGLNIEATEEVARESGLRVTAAGGVGRLRDIREIQALEPLGVDEVIVGKALYEGRFTLAEAIVAAAGDAPC
jgi:phosphoribosylformimino-5-aminoimidazole carboxamide ribotide isomerase